MSPLGETSREGLLLRGAARDLLTGTDGGAAVVAVAAAAAELGPARTLRSLSLSPEAPGADALIGSPVGSGFRARVGRALAEHSREQTPLFLLVDDLPVAALIAGYADMYVEPRESLAPEDERRSRVEPLAASMADICSGWASGGTMLSALRETAALPVPVGPEALPAEPGEDPQGWHALPVLEAGAMRRRRLLDVARPPEPGADLAVRAMFRDTHVGHDGVERVLHEYQLQAEIDPTTGVVTRCVAWPRVLPWPECPSAASSTDRLVGQPVTSIRALVQQQLRGLGTCTHLNDLLRSLADVVPLARDLGVGMVTGT